MRVRNTRPALVGFNTSDAMCERYSTVGWGSFLCDNCGQAGGECEVDFGTEARLDMSILWLGWGVNGPDH